MKTVFLFLFFFSYTWALPVSITTFTADFEQLITDEHNKTIRYSGTIVAKAPGQALWNYVAPIQKKVLINGNRVTIIEPDLEQAILKRIDGDIDFFALLKKALPIGDGRYLANYHAKEFTLYFTDTVIDKITYYDDFDNSVVLHFTNQVQNEPVDSDRLTVTIPAEYDIVQD